MQGSEEDTVFIFGSIAQPLPGDSCLQQMAVHARTVRDTVKECHKSAVPGLMNKINYDHHAAYDYR